MAPATRVRFYLPAEEAEWAGQALLDFFPDGLFQGSQKPGAPAPVGPLRLEGWLKNNHATGLLRARLGELGAGRMEFKAVRLPDWRARSKKGFPVQEIGPWTIVPAWRSPRIKPGKLPIRLLQGQAFGTGLHASTRLMLAALKRRATRLTGLKILDVGAGSGILGFAALSLGAGRVDAVEAEPGACREMRENRALNHVPPSRFVVYPGFFPQARGLASGPRDLLLANLTTETLLPLLQKFRAWLKPGGALLMSGIYRSPEMEQVCRQAAKAGWRVVDRRRLGAWWHVEAQKR